MQITPSSTLFTQMHIDAARFSTDDFNPFHDKNRWQQIAGNPFAGPLVLGFQLGALIEDQLRQYRQAHDEQRLIDQHGLRYSNYQFDFVSPVLPGEEITLEIKPSVLVTTPTALLRNRLLLRVGQRIALIGQKRESQRPLVLADSTPVLPERLITFPDREFLPMQTCFLKRKFMMTANGKNFLLGAAVEPSSYFDELEDRVNFPEMFPLSYLSCALLERGLKAGEDFMQRPMIYISHQISVDRLLMERLESNAALHLLIGNPSPPSDFNATRAISACQQNFPCFGVLDDGALLYRALMTLVPLAAIRNQ